MRRVKESRRVGEKTEFAEEMVSKESDLGLLEIVENEARSFNSSILIRCRINSIGKFVA